MRIKTNTLIAIFVLSLLLTACLPGRSRVRLTPTITPDIQATILAGVNVKLQLTRQAMEPTETLAVRLVPVTDGIEYSVDDLAAQIERAVKKTGQVLHKANLDTINATANGSVTQEEVDTLKVDLQDCVREAAQVSDLVLLVTNQYSGLMPETMIMFKQVGAHFQDISNNVNDIFKILRLGDQAANQVINKLNSSMQYVDHLAADTQAGIPGILAQLKQEQSDRVHQVENIQPSEEAVDLDGTTQQLQKFTTAIHDSLADGNINLAELNKIGRYGANARVSLLKNIGPKLKTLGNTIDELVQQLARGEWPQAVQNLDNLEKMFLSKP